MSQPTFPGGIDLLPGPQGPPIPVNALRIVTIGGAPFSTTDGITFTALGGGAGTVASVTGAAAGIVDNTDPANPIIDVQVCAADAWGDMVGRFIAGKVPSLANMVFRSRLATGFTQEIERGTAVQLGTATIDSARAGGVMILATGTTANGYQPVRNVNATGGAGGTGPKAIFVPNVRTSKWAIATRLMFDAPSAGCTYYACNMTDETTADQFLGVLGSTSTANWVMKLGTGSAVDLGVDLPVAAFITVAMIADGTNVQAWNVDAGTAIGTAQPQSTCITQAGHWSMIATNSATVNKQVYIDDSACFTEAAA